MSVSHAPAPAVGDEPLVSINQVPQFRHLSPATRWRIALSGQLACVRLGRRLYTTASAVHAYLDARRITPGELAAPVPVSRRDAQKAAATAQARAQLGMT